MSIQLNTSMEWMPKYIVRGKSTNNNKPSPESVLPVLYINLPYVARKRVGCNKQYIPEF